MDKEVFVPLNTFQFVAFAAPIVKISGAVSPAARAMASRHPLMIPGAADGSTTRTVVRLVLPPSAYAESRGVGGPNRSHSHDAANTIGNISQARDSAPLKPLR